MNTKPTIEQAQEFRKKWSHKPTAITADSSGLWYSEECTDELLVAFASQQPGANRLSIEEMALVIAKYWSDGEDTWKRTPEPGQIARLNSARPLVRFLLSKYRIERK